MVDRALNIKDQSICPIMSNAQGKTAFQLICACSTHNLCLFNTQSVLVDTQPVLSPTIKPLQILPEEVLRNEMCASPMQVSIQSGDEGPKVVCSWSQLLRGAIHHQVLFKTASDPIRCYRNKTSTSPWDSILHLRRIVHDRFLLTQHTARVASRSVCPIMVPDGGSSP